MMIRRHELSKTRIRPYDISLDAARIMLSISKRIVVASTQLINITQYIKIKLRLSKYCVAMNYVTASS